MSNFLFLLTFVAAALLLAVASQNTEPVHSYCAEISSSSASGVHGYYALQIIGGYAYHAYSIDLTSSSVDTSTCSYSGSTYLSYSLQVNIL